MYMSLSCMTLILSAAANGSYSQNRIAGRVLYENGNPAEGFVTLGLPGDVLVLAFAIIEEDGSYSLAYNGKEDSIRISVSGLGLENASKVVANRTQKLDFTVKAKDVDLQEVSIKADPVTVRGDTTDYLVSSYAEQGDRVIGDVLKKIPGMEVSESGGISYNGKPISKFYVEEMDMLQGRYGLAVKNVKADDVGKVQVMEHHQPIRMMKGRTYSDDIAVNLKLKEKAKGTYALTTALGAGLQQGQGSGAGGLWNEELIGMYFGKDRQTMQTCKGNNSAEDILSELASQYGGSDYPVPISRVGVLSPGTPSLPQKRYVDNQTHAVSANWLEKLDGDREMTFNAVYSHDRQDREGYTYTEKYRPEVGNVRIHEMQSSRDKSHNLEVSHKYSNNADSKYTTNTLSARISWNDAAAHGRTVGQGYDSSVGQDMKSIPISFCDKAVIQRLLGENVFRFNFSFGYSQSAQTLQVTEYETELRVQELMPRSISMSAFTSYEKDFGQIRGEYGLSTNAMINGEDGMLTGVEGISEEESRNDMWYGTYRLNAFQSYKYQKNDCSVVLTLPVALDLQSLNDKVRKTRRTFFRPIVMPSLSADYDWNIFHALHAKVGYDQQVGGLNNIFQGYVMENYRTMMRSRLTDMFKCNSVSASGGYRYSNALRQVHFNANVGYSHTWRNQMGSIVYDGIFSSSVVEDRHNTSSSLSAGIGASKNFDWLRSSVKCNVGYSHGTYQRLLESQMVHYRQNSGSLSVSASATPVGWLGMVVSFGGMIGKTQDERTQSPTTKDYMGRLSLKFYPTKQLTVNISGEGTYDNWAERDNYRYFCDFGVQYNIKRVALELEGNNLLNQKKYVLNRTDNMDIYHLEYSLRPVNVLLKVRFKIL